MKLSTLRIITLLAAGIEVPSVWAQVTKDCFFQSKQSFGGQQGTNFSSMGELAAIDFDRTMVLNEVWACFDAKSRIHSIKLKTKGMLN